MGVPPPTLLRYSSCIAYGHPPTDVEAIGQNQAAAVWWKSIREEGPSSGCTEVRRKEGAANPEGGAGREEDDDPKNLTIIGHVVYRYRLDGREWHKKGGTNVDGVKTTSTRITGLQNGSVYR